MDEASKYQKDVNESILTGIIQVLKEIDNIKKEQKDMSQRLSEVQQTQRSLGNFVRDTSIMTSNLVNDMEDLRSDVNTINDKVDALDNTMRNLRIFKYFSTDET